MPYLVDGTGTEQCPIDTYENLVLDDDQLLPFYSCEGRQEVMMAGRDKNIYFQNIYREGVTNCANLGRLDSCRLPPSVHMHENTQYLAQTWVRAILRQNYGCRDILSLESYTVPPELYISPFSPA